eukprot:scaffold12203_cov65-Phaeocystis_antarctica.AAC.2
MSCEARVLGWSSPMFQMQGWSSPMFQMRARKGRLTTHHSSCCELLRPQQRPCRQGPQGSVEVYVFSSVCSVKDSRNKDSNNITASPLHATMTAHATRPTYTTLAVRELTSHRPLCNLGARGAARRASAEGRCDRPRRGAQHARGNARTMR